MPDRTVAFFTLSLAALIVVLLIAGMKYFTAARASGGRASLAALQAELAEVKLRLASIENLLKEVG